MGVQSKARIERISIECVQKRMKELVFIDARSATALSRNPLQISGAIHLSAKEVKNGMAHVPENRTLVTYCT